MAEQNTQRDQHEQERQVASENPHREAQNLGPAELLNSPPSSASGICTAVAAAVSIATFAEIGFGGLFVSHDLLVFFGADNQGRKEADGREATGDHEVNVAVAKNARPTSV